MDFFAHARAVLNTASLRTATALPVTIYNEKIPSMENLLYNKTVA
jgi:hypothetical protein